MHLLRFVALNYSVHFVFPKEIRYQDSHFSVLLRPLEEKDAEVIHDAVIMSLESLRPFMAWVHEELSVEKQITRIRKSKEAYAKGVECDFSVFNEHTGEFLMTTTLGPSRAPNRNALSIGYWSSLPQSNKGFATLITKILIIVAFEHIGCDRLEIGCNKENKQSIRVIEKCGFIFEGEARNYFSEPTSEMMKNGYCLNKTCLQYALTPQDRKSLPWFQAMQSKIQIVS